MSPPEAKAISAPSGDRAGVASAGLGTTGWAWAQPAVAARTAAVSSARQNLMDTIPDRTRE